MLEHTSAAKTTVIGLLAALINYSDPATFGAAVTGALVYYVLFADRGRWTNILLFLISVPISLHISPVIAQWLGFTNQSGVALFCGALGLMTIEKLAMWIKNPGAFIRVLREGRNGWRSLRDDGEDRRQPRRWGHRGEDDGQF